MHFLRRVVFLHLLSILSTSLLVLPRAIIVRAVFVLSFAFPFFLLGDLLDSPFSQFVHCVRLEAVAAFLLFLPVDKHERSYVSVCLEFDWFLK